MNKQTKLIIIVFCVINLALHLVADWHSGFVSDELLHIATGNHLAFGYMEFPPVLGILAFIQNLFHSQSVFIHHIFAHLATVLIMLYASKITIELGGKSIAVFVVLFCLLISPGLQGSQQVFEPVVFSQLFWVISFYYLTLFIKNGHRKDLWYLTAFVVIFFLTKYDAIFLLVGLLPLFFLQRIRENLIQNRFWQCVIVAALLLLPNFIWQFVHGFPAVVMFRRLYETQLDDLKGANVFRELFFDMNPVSFLLMLPGLFLMLLGKQMRILYRPLAISILISIICLLGCKGKTYCTKPCGSPPK